MSSMTQGAATGKHQLDGPPRLNSSRCGDQYTSANALIQAASTGSAAHNRKGDKMNQELTVRAEGSFSAIEQVVMQGDLSKLNSEQRVTYYRKVCESQGLNPFTNPFAYIFLNGKLTLYAKKDCTEQLRKINGVSIEELNDKLVDDIYVVTAKARDKNGRIDQANGAVVLGSLKGEAKANAIMKAETKAKRRVTLSICGMGWTDESEIDSIPNAQHVDVDFQTGEIKGVVKASHNQASEPIEVRSKLTSDQIDELEIILDECSEKYRGWVFNHVKKMFGTDDLSGVTSDMYPRMKAAALKNIEQERTRHQPEPSELIATEA